jgi:hypothetical protein
MQVTAPIYETPSRLSQGLVVCLSIAVVAMAGWFAMTILAPPEAAITAGGEMAATPVAAPASPAEEPVASGLQRSLRPAARPVQFDWPEEFNDAPASPARAALPFAPAELPAARDPGRAVVWPAGAPVPDGGDRSSPARQPAPAAGNTTDAIVDLLAPPSGRDAAVPLPRPVPARR